MKKVMKCCLAVALGFAAVGYSKDAGHGKVQLWKDGPYWAETNIGAEKPWDFGYHFWWGDTVGYKRVNDAWVASDGSSSNFSFEQNNTLTHAKDDLTLMDGGWVTVKVKEGGDTIDYILAPKHDAAHVHWGGNWRMPTKQELDGLFNKCDWAWTTMHGVNGYAVRGRGDYALASIFLPCAGFAFRTLFRFDNSEGGYWSSSLDEDVSEDAWNLTFDSSKKEEHIFGRYFGQCIRPVQGGEKGSVDKVD